MTAFVYTTLLIKPLTIGRGQGPSVLSDILLITNLHLVNLRVWDVCPTTWGALKDISRDTDSALLEDEELVVSSNRLSWICLFKHRDDETHPGPVLRALFGPKDRTLWTRNHLRFKYSSYSSVGPAASIADDVVYIAPTGKEKLTSLILFDKFDESEIFS